MSERTIDELMNDTHTNEMYGYALIKEWVDAYPISAHPMVNDELIEKLARGLRYINFNHVVVPGDVSICPNCDFVNGCVEQKGLAFYVNFGNNITSCMYCSLNGLYETIIDHNLGNCDCPEEKSNQYYWSKDDCLRLYSNFETLYNKVLEEL